MPALILFFCLFATSVFGQLKMELTGCKIYEEADRRTWVRCDNDNTVVFSEESNTVFLVNPDTDITFHMDAQLRSKEAWVVASKNTIILFTENTITIK